MSKVKKKETHEIGNQAGKRIKVRPTNPAQTILRLFSYLKYHKFLLIFGLFFVVLSSLGNIAINSLLSPIFDSLGGPQPLQTLLRFLVIMGITVIVVAIAEYLGNITMARMSQTIVHRIRGEMFRHMQSLPLKFFDNTPHGDLMSVFTNDVDLLNQALEQSLAQIVISLVTVIGTFTMMIIFSPLLTLIVVVMLAVMILVARFVASRSAKNYRRLMASLGNLNGYIEEYMAGQKVVKVFNYEEQAIEDFAALNEEMRQSSSRAAAYSIVLMPLMGNLSYVLYAIVAIVGAFLALAGSMSVGNIVSFLQFTRTISRPITQISNQFNSLVAALAGAERIFRLLDETPESNDGKIRLHLVDEDTLRELKERQPDLRIDPDKAIYRQGKILLWEIPQDDGTYRYRGVRGDVRMHDVDFGYEPDEMVLHDISLFAKPGQKLALVGSTGAGKTTITNLLNRFYEIDDGSITFDDIDIREIDKEHLRSLITMVLQDVHLFKGTIADNIRYGRLDATDEEVREAARLANAEHFIKLLPDGYDSELTRDGLNLSQGERQLLSIARAAVSNPIVLVLDEATSSVDTRTERLIEKGMDSLMEDSTTFAIAHRLSTVRHSNAIMVMEDGRIIERGTHDELMEMRGRYYHLNIGTIELE